MTSGSSPSSATGWPSCMPGTSSRRLRSGSSSRIPSTRTPSSCSRPIRAPRFAEPGWPRSPAASPIPPTVPPAAASSRAAPAPSRSAPNPRRGSPSREEPATCAACTMSPNAPLIEVEGLGKQFRLGRSLGELVRRGPIRALRAVDAVSLTIRYGETVGLVGESGSGKTTLGRMIAGLERPTSGRVLLEGRDLLTLTRTERSSVFRTVQMVFQDPFASLDPRQTVADIIREPLEIHGLGDRRERRLRVEELLDQVALPRRYAASLPHELSGGLRQRVGIASALALRPKLIVADEPTSALDASVQAEIINLLSELQQATGVAFLFISHNLDVVRYISHRVAVMYLGRIVELGDVGRVYEGPRHPYTRALLSAVPVPDPAVPLNPVQLSGDIPSPIDLPPGCAFNPRCRLAEDVCRAQVPPLYVFDPAHRAACHVTASAEGARSPGSEAVQVDAPRPA